jgi:hypothetical protein
MGCCAQKAKFQLELPLEKMEEYDKLKMEIEEFLSSKDLKDKKNKNKILDFSKKLSNYISKYEKDLLKLKRDNTKNENISDDLIEGMNQDIKILKDYQTTLNNLLAESEKKNLNEGLIINQIIINNSSDEENNLKNNNEHIDGENNNDKESSDIYFKKCIRRNKKGILNQKYNIRENNIMSNDETDKKMECTDTKDNQLLYQNSINNINIIFEFENGKKIGLQANKEEKLKDVIAKLGESGIGDKLDNLQFFDGNNNIKDKILNGEKVGNFNLNDFHVVKIKTNNENQS